MDDMSDSPQRGIKDTIDSKVGNDNRREAVTRPEFLHRGIGRYNPGLLLGSYCVAHFMTGLKYSKKDAKPDEAAGTCDEKLGRHVRLSDALAVLLWR